MTQNFVKKLFLIQINKSDQSIVFVYKWLTVS